MKKIINSLVITLVIALMLLKYCVMVGFLIIAIKMLQLGDITACALCFLTFWVMFRDIFKGAER